MLWYARNETKNERMERQIILPTPAFLQDIKTKRVRGRPAKKEKKREKVRLQFNSRPSFISFLSVHKLQQVSAKKTEHVPACPLLQIENNSENAGYDQRGPKSDPSINEKHRKENLPPLYRGEGTYRRWSPPQLEEISLEWIIIGWTAVATFAGHHLKVQGAKTTCLAGPGKVPTWEIICLLNNLIFISFIHFVLFSSVILFDILIFLSMVNILFFL